MKQNLISGNIPYGIGKLHKLNFLDLAYNKLSGNVPPVFGNLTSLLNLYLESNKFTGPIPQSLGKARGLLELYLSNNQLSGPIPKEIFQISSLSIMLNISANHFIGEIPSAVGNLKLLTTLDLSDNEISGEITDGFVSCTQLELIYLGGNELHGSIPRAFGALKSMQALDLSRNKLSGHFPRFLETLPLIKLNLSFNDFQGEVPTKGVFANVTSISLVGNDKLCGGVLELQLPKCPTSGKIKNHHMVHVRNILLSVISSCVFVGAILMCCIIFRRLQKRKLPLPATSIPSKEMPIVSHKQLLEVTDNFPLTNLIGVGHFGSVYKGTLDEESGEMVAIKVLNPFMQNGSLDKWLHPVVDGHIQNEPPILSLLQRIQIATDVACGLDYLHNEIEKPIVHCDLKPSNILLDDEMTAHISDFGLSKFLPSTSDKVINILDPMLLSEYEGAQDSRNQHRDAWQKCSESMVQIGVQCSMELPQNRTEVHSVLHELQKLKHVLGNVETQPLQLGLVFFFFFANSLFAPTLLLPFLYRLESNRLSSSLQSPF